jgi:hypothetical protein
LSVTGIEEAVAATGHAPLPLQPLHKPAPVEVGFYPSGYLDGSDIAWKVTADKADGAGALRERLRQRLLRCCVLQVGAPSAAGPKGMEAAAFRVARAPGLSSLAVLTRRFVDAGDGWLSCECGVAAMVVVGVQEVCQGCGPFVVGGVEPLVGPFVEQGAVEALDLAVGLGAVGAGEFAGGAQVGQGLLNGVLLR